MEQIQSTFQLQACAQ